MGDLDGFSKRSKAQTRSAPPSQPPVQSAPGRVPAQPAAKQPFDRDRCPLGYDTDVWHLALLFEQYAHADQIELTTGRPVIYAEIFRLVERYRLRKQTFVQYAEACTRRKLPKSLAEHCWLHTRTEVRHRAITWVEMVEVIMEEFWSCIQDAHALDWFRQKFPEYGTMAVKHWASLSAIETINARPVQERAVMRRRTSGATMPDVSKEGE
jgi:hypothetical protein